jgi:nitrate/nitrite transporter NarK
MLTCLVGLYTQVSKDHWTTVALLAGVGFFGASYPMVMAHGRAFLPPHLTGRGVSLINLFGIGGAGIMQIITGRLHAALTPSESVMNSAPPTTPYAALFVFYTALTAAGLAIYLLSRDRRD